MTRNDMRSFHDHFKGVPDVRRLKGRKHGVANVLALAAGHAHWYARLQGHLGVASTLSQVSVTVEIPVLLILLYLVRRY